jgi:hypothetical protein
MAAEPRQLLSEFVVDHLQDLVLKTEDVREMLDELADFTALTLSDPAIDFCSITLIRHKKPVTVASSERGAARLDETQYAAGEGPCLTAIREQAPIHVPDLVREHRWPAYGLEYGQGNALLINMTLASRVAVVPVHSSQGARRGRVGPNTPKSTAMEQRNVVCHIQEM